MAIYRAFWRFRSDGRHNGRWWLRAASIFRQPGNLLSEAIDLRDNVASPTGDEKSKKGRSRAASARTSSPGRSPMVALTVNGQRHEVDAAPDTPLLWVLREHLKLTGTKFGCGIAACGACTVHIDGEAVRACSMPLSLVADKSVTTIEGLSADGSHPLQKAWIAEQVPQCGYCQSGQIMQAATLLVANKNPSRDDIVEHMDGNICRCGTYLKIISAIERAAREG